MSCRLWHPWVVGDTYRFHLQAQGDGWFTVTVNDQATGETFALGSVQVDPSVTGIGSATVSQWTEYFEWNDPRTVCRTVPYSSATFSLVGEGGAVTPVLSQTNPNSTCASYSQFVVSGAGVTEINGVGSSVRGPVLAPNGECLTAEGGANAGAHAILFPCPGLPTSNEEWVLAGDGSMRLQGNLCLTAPLPDAGGAGLDTVSSPASTESRRSSGDSPAGSSRD